MNIRLRPARPEMLELHANAIWAEAVANRDSLDSERGVNLVLKKLGQAVADHEKAALEEERTAREAIAAQRKQANVIRKLKRHIMKLENPDMVKEQK